MYLIGYDIGSSSVKAALIEAASGKTIQLTQHPAIEMDIISRQTGWAEQHPELWWEALCIATKTLLENSKVNSEDIKSIGISYQMHGLVLVDKNQHVLRPAIIWCDSRAVDIGKKAFDSLGQEHCLSHYLNSPGNFTASKLKWVKDNEPQVYNNIHKAMLPGDYIAMRLTGEINTTISGLSEGILWDFKNHTIANRLLDHYGIDPNLFPSIKDGISNQGQLTKSAAEATGLSTKTIVGYRAGDQPNNALSLGVFEPNEVAATGGTSGVVYGISDEYIYDEQSRINGFAHINHQKDQKRVGLLLCINGAGIQYSWIRQQIAREGTSYADMERMISSIPIGADGLRIIPFGNGSERMLENKTPGAQVNNLQFNRHTRAHFYRAALEGIAFSFVYGFQVLKELGIQPNVIKVGNDNLFQSPVFSKTIANLLECPIQVMNSTGAVGAAKAGGVGAGVYKNLTADLFKNNIQETFYPENQNGQYLNAFYSWQDDLDRLLGTKSEKPIAQNLVH